MAVVIKKCDCNGTPKQSSEFQDQEYGKGMRVCNLDMKKTAATCTICGKEHRNALEK